MAHALVQPILFINPDKIKLFNKTSQNLLHEERKNKMCLFLYAMNEVSA